MSTPNFHMMDNFGLFVKVYEPLDAEEYADEEEVLSDEALAEIFYEDIWYGYDGFKDIMEDFNNYLLFHQITLKSGYYDGVQLYVEETENPNELDNDDCRYYYDMCRSQAIRKYDAEIRKINKWMEKTAVEYGWKELNCLGIFSNGEAIYEYA